MAAAHFRLVERESPGKVPHPAVPERSGATSPRTLRRTSAWRHCWLRVWGTGACLRTQAIRQARSAGERRRGRLRVARETGRRQVPASGALQAPDLVPVVHEPLPALREIGQARSVTTDGEGDEVPRRVVLRCQRTAAGARGARALELVRPRVGRPVHDSAERTVVEPLRVVPRLGRVPEPVVVPRLPQHTLVEADVLRRLREPRVDRRPAPHRFFFVLER